MQDEGLRGGWEGRKYSCREGRGGDGVEVAERILVTPDNSIHDAFSNETTSVVKSGFL